MGKKPRLKRAELCPETCTASCRLFDTLRGHGWHRRYRSSVTRKYLVNRSTDGLRCCRFQQ
eukprot:scaffold2429_cov165-Amphora_coffeaeformis.AAC.3